MLALTREVSPLINECELTFREREPISVARAREQHELYENRLRALGWEVRRLSGTAEFPDSVFIEDTAVVLDEIALIAQLGVESRRGETAEVEEALRPLRQIAKIEPPGTLDGGDVLRVGRYLFVGLSQRTNEQGVEQVDRLARPFGYEVSTVPVERCLHLKTGVTCVGPNQLLMNRDWIPDNYFRSFEIIDADPAEPFAANALYLGGVVIVSNSFPHTRERLENAGIRTITVNGSELEKAEGGVTCCSLLVR